VGNSKIYLNPKPLKQSLTNLSKGRRRTTPNCFQLLLFSQNRN
jgi:hypothetical protein